MEKTIDYLYVCMGCGEGFNDKDIVGLVVLYALSSYIFHWYVPFVYLHWPE